jgi:ribosomal protein L7/L12
MTRQEFDGLAERVLHSVIRGALVGGDAYATAGIALRIAADFETALNEHHREKWKSTDLTEEEVSLVHKGNVIGAIKLVRERTGRCLKDAKHLVDDYRRDAGLL